MNETPETIRTVAELDDLLSRVRAEAKAMAEIDRERERRFRADAEQQAARLAAVLPNPWRYRAEPPSPYVAQRAKWIEQQMDQLGYVWLKPVTGQWPQCQPTLIWQSLQPASYHRRMGSHQ